ncbi:hypothetical protein ANCDUO_15713 [Ancylostoma duodenale]|uniref:Serine-tRNA synthetase type1 N-terminal domain-containing protein n=1 Tax=Ancylostoma duodenale TaxID=51022 RepID=A0A0C2GB54_9BILA|nr:hypothetical protein ANCDUO_15713 [Ancylostoma duodenale]
MVLDMDLFREEKGGNPEKIRTSQRHRYQDPALVDKVIETDQAWRKGTDRAVTILARASVL